MGLLPADTVLHQAAHRPVAIHLKAAATARLPVATVDRRNTVNLRVATVDRLQVGSRRAAARRWAAPVKI